MSDPVFLPDDASDALPRHATVRAMQAINEAFEQLHVLTESATDQSELLEPPLGPKRGEREAMQIARYMTGRGLTVGAVPRDDTYTRGSVEIFAPIQESKRVISRLSHHDDRYDLDVNLFLPGLDQYTATAVKRLLTKNLSALIQAARQDNADQRVRQLIQAIAPTDPLADIQLKVAESTMSLRQEFLDENSVLTSAQVHANAGFTGSNPSQTVLRWRKQGLIFAISQGGREFYPAFQFGKDGRPRSIIAELLTILGKDRERSDWDNALWFAGDTGWLDGKTPIECLQSDPELVKQAAEQEVLVDETDEY